MSSIGINTGLKALLSARYMLDTIGHNIANANTPGYSRQRVQLGSALPIQLGGLLIGGGVDAGRVQRSVDELLGRRIQGQHGLMGSLTTLRGGLSDLEALVAEPGENGLGSLLDGFFSSLSQLSTGPADPILRTSVVRSTDALTARFRELSHALDASASDAVADVSSRLSEVNGLADEIVTLNQKIGETESVGIPANDLRDRRDAALTRLSELVDVTPVDGPNGSVRVLVAGNTLVGTARANHLSLATEGPGQGQAGQGRIRIQGANGFVPIQGGEIGGLLRLSDELAPAYSQRLDQLAHELILEVNRTHTTGIPASGAFHALTGAASLQDFDQDGRVQDELLANAGLPFDVGTGSLYVNVSDESSGTIEKHRIDITATHTTVQDFLDELNALPHLSASLDAGGHLRIGADEGFGFDFSRRIDADPDPEGLFGGARATLGTSASGPFALADGDTLDLTVSTGGAPVSFSLAFAATDFQEISTATADEVAAAINAAPQAQANGLHASAVDGHLFVQTLSQGSNVSLTIAGGTAVNALGWSGFVGASIQGQTNAVDVRLSGAFTGAADERFEFRPTSDGTIGTTAGLEVEVLDRAGNHVTTLDVGAGYVPGTELEVGQGIRVSFGLGQLSATHGDLLAADAVADPDSTDVLVALGLNTMLSGSDASDIAMRADLRDDPAQLAVSLSGEEGDGALLLELVEIEKQATGNLGGVSVGRFWGDLAGDVGFEAALADSALAAGDAVMQSLEQRQASISGVNVDEELVDLVAYEQSFAAAAQYLSVVNQLGDELLSLLSSTNMRIGTFSAYGRILLGMRASQFSGLRAQEQISSGRRILRPSDDPAGTARSLALRRGLAQSGRLQDAIATGRLRLDQATTTLQDSSGLLTRARELVLQAMSGALQDGDRASIAAELEEIREQLLDDASLQVDGNYVFGGTALGSEPWVSITSGGTTHVQYRGNGQEQSIQIGEDADLAISAIGNHIFGRAVPGAVRFDGLTGVRSGTTADEGSGYAYLVLRQDGTDTGLLGSVGAALIDGDDRNTLLGQNTLRIDSTAGTVQLENGPPVKIPLPGARTDVTVRNEQGGELHLDLEGWNGNDYTGTITGRGSVSLDGQTFTTLAFTETDLELANPELGQVLHLDTTGVLRAGRELVTFGDTVNAFDLLQGVIEDLENDQGLDSAELNTRLSNRMQTLDRVHDDLLLGLGVLGARGARLDSADARQSDLGLQLRGRLSEVEDTDLSEAALELTRSQMTLELAQAAGARLIQTSMLNFLG